MGQLEHLERKRRGEAVHAGDTVTHLQDGPDLVGLGDALVLLDLGAQDLGDLVGAELHRVVVTFLVLLERSSVGVKPRRPWTGRRAWSRASDASPRVWCGAMHQRRRRRHEARGRR